MNLLQPPLKIVQYPHPSLRHPAKPLTAITREVQQVAEAMLALMYEHRGLGLAAPQVGIPWQMFVANYTADPQQPDMQGVFINPVIIDKRGSMESEEGCLSFPDLYQKVRRARTIKAQAYNLKGEIVEVEVSELPARVWQHEVDHLHGILFIDKIGMIGQLATRGALREFEAQYKKAQQRGEIAPDPEIENRLRELEALA